MKNQRIAVWVLFIFLPVGAISAASWLWHGRTTRPSTHKPAVTASDSGQQQEQIAAANATLIVDYRDDFTDDELARTPEVEEPVSRWSVSDRLYRVRFPSAQMAAEAIVRLAANSRVESVDWDSEAAIPPDERGDQAQAPTDDRSMQAECGTASGAATSATAGESPSDPCYRYQWHMAQVGLPAAWQLGQGQGVVVAVIDTGVSRVPDLAQTSFVPGYNFVNDNDDAADDHGHGTHVAGTIAQSTNNKLGVGGVAFKASIMPLKVLSARGSGSMASIAQAIRFAADHGAKVINMSLGGPMPVGAIGSAVKYARGKGVTVVAAAGNDGRGKVSYPARYPGVIAVAATQFDEKTTFYSNWGPQVDVAAPGGNVRVDQNGDGKPDGVLQNTIVPGNTSKTDYLWFMGTSMASPHVAGVAALIVGAGVTKPDAVEEVLLDTARQPKTQSRTQADSSGRIDDHYGAGLVDARAALAKIRNGRGAGELGMGGLLALLGVGFLSRRGRLGAQIGRPGIGFVAALVLGSSGLFLLPSWASAWPLSMGILDAADGLLPLDWRGNPLLWSALLPVGLTALLYGSERLRGVLAGFGFGVAGALLFAAIASTFDIRLVPDLLDRPWLVANAILASVVAGGVLRR
ncbi:MAG: peptidase S8 [Deltaproteobacteria bacterium]|nr:peptidase S8 [Deltaproteobacteria bacterium]